MAKKEFQAESKKLMDMADLDVELDFHPYELRR